MNINPSPEMSSSISLPDLTAEVPSPSPAVSGKSLLDVTEMTPVPSSDPLPIVSEPEDGAKSISMETESSIITIIKKPISEDGFSVPEHKKRARPTSPKKGSGGVELSNSFSPLDKSPNSKKQAVSVAEGSEADPSNSSTPQPRLESCRSKLQGLSKPETKAGKTANVATKGKSLKETKIPSSSTPSAAESASRKPKFSRQDFFKGPKEKAPQSKQDKTGKKPA